MSKIDKNKKSSTTQNVVEYPQLSEFLKLENATMSNLLQKSAEIYAKNVYLTKIIDSSSSSNNNNNNKKSSSSSLSLSYVTYEEAWQISRKIAHYLVRQSFVQKNALNCTRVAFNCENCLESRYFYQAVAQTKIVAVPLYRALGESNILYVLNQTKCSIILCDSYSKLEMLLKNAKSLPYLKQIITIDLDFESENARESKSKENVLNNLLPNHEKQLSLLLSSNAGNADDYFTIKDYRKDIINDSAQNVAAEATQQIEAPEADDIAVIFSTSGSTALPKLALHSHLTLGMHILAISSRISTPFANQKCAEIRLYQILTEQHIFAFVATLGINCYGGRLCYSSSKLDARRVLPRDLSLFKPTAMAVVPLILSRLEKRVRIELKSASGGGGNKAAAANSMLNGILSKLKVKVFNFFYNYSSSVSQNSNNNGGGSRNALMDYLASNFVFKRIKNSLGGEIKALICGGAYLDRSTMQFVETTVSCRVIQGYGLTEMLATLIGASDIGYHCGKPLEGVDLVLKSVPEMGYFAEEQRGEICLKGDLLFKGYLQPDGSVDRCLNADGYFETGDIAQIDSQNCLRIIDRKKNIFKLAQGEFVSPIAIQDQYLKFSALKDCFIYGDFTRSALVGVAFLDQDSYSSWISTSLLSSSSSSSSSVNNVDNNNNNNNNRNINNNNYDTNNKCRNNSNNNHDDDNNMNNKKPQSSSSLLLSKFSNTQLQQLLSKRVEDAFAQNGALLTECLKHDLDKFAARNAINGLQRVKNWCFKSAAQDVPSVENNLLTVTLKQKRKVFEETFKIDIDCMYKMLGDIAHSQ